MTVNPEAVTSNEEWMEMMIEGYRLERKYPRNGTLTIERGGAEGHYVVTVSGLPDDFPNQRQAHVWDAVWDPSSSTLTADTNYLKYAEDTQTGVRTYGYEGNKGRAIAVNVVVLGVGDGHGRLAFRGELIDLGETVQKYAGMQCGVVSGTKISDTVEKVD